MKLLLCITFAACGRPEPKLSVLQREVFSVSCAFSSCHGGSVPEAGLDLRPGHSYASLVGRGAEHDPAYLLVAPGVPDASYLIDKIYGRKRSGPARHAESDIMPPVDSGTLEEHWKQAVSEWVARGAHDD